VATEGPPDILYTLLPMKNAVLTPSMSVGNLPLPQILPRVCTGVKYIPPFHENGFSNINFMKRHSSMQDFISLPPDCTLTSDLTGDRSIDFDDLMAVANNWLKGCS
jgi:hypothetical protein